MLLIISNKSDLATDFLVSRLHSKKIPFLRVNTEDFLSEWIVEFEIERHKHSFSIRTKQGNYFEAKDIAGAYIRQPKMPILDVQKDHEEFANREVGETLRSLWRFIDDKKWLNAPHNILRASNKPEQLCIASNMGFCIPDTCITTTKSKMIDFFKKYNGGVIVKAVKHGFLYDGENATVAGTQLIDHYFFDNISSYVELPMIFQENIQKEFDVRVTVVGNQVFATAIYSQNNPKTAIDWRLADHYKINLEHKAIKLPTAINDLCRKITSTFNLKYSAIDLVLNQSGEYVFLELNPNGQWAWIEQLTGYPIRDAIIKELVGNKG